MNDSYGFFINTIAVEEWFGELGILKKVILVTIATHVQAAVWRGGKYIFNAV